jgi:adhesin transport system outer membrane protein
MQKYKRDLMKNKLFLSLCIGFSLNAADLQTTLTEVLATNPVIQERLQNYKATQEDIASAQSGYCPKLDLNLGVGYEKTDRSNPSNDASLNVYQNSLKYTQNLFNGFATSYQVKSTEYKTLSAAYSYAEKVNTTSYNFVNAYLEVLQNLELLKTAQQNVQINADVLKKVNKLYKSGFTTLSEVNKIQSSLSLAKSNLVVQENTLLDKEYALERIVGHKIDIHTLEPFTLDIELPTTKEKIIDYALKHNPSLLVSEFNKRSAQTTNKQQKANYYPKIDIELSQSMNSNLNGIEGDTDTFKAMAYLSYNLFNGFSDKHAIVKSLAQIEQENQNQNNVKRQILQTINSSWSSRQKLQEQLAYLKEYNDYSQKTLALYRKEYALGQRSLLDLLASQNDLIKSQEQIINTNYSLMYANYRLLESMSTLVSSILGSSDVYTRVNIHNKREK